MVCSVCSLALSCSFPVSFYLHIQEGLLFFESATSHVTGLSCNGCVELSLCSFIKHFLVNCFTLCRTQAEMMSLGSRIASVVGGMGKQIIV